MVVKDLEVLRVLWLPKLLDTTGKRNTLRRYEFPLDCLDIFEFIQLGLCSQATTAI